MKKRLAFSLLISASSLYAAEIPKKTQPVKLLLAGEPRVITPLAGGQYLKVKHGNNAGTDKFTMELIESCNEGDLLISGGCRAANNAVIASWPHAIGNKLSWSCTLGRAFTDWVAWTEISVLCQKKK